MQYIKLKRVADVVLSFMGMVVLAPVIFVIAVAIKLDSSGPILFRQKRVGKGKSHFHILKFRTMRTDTPSDTPTHLLADPESYITRVGRFLRMSSLDELPQIWNILIGDMSIVGPRPALWNQYDLIAERDKYAANDVAPGMTGWAQVNGRDELGIEEKAKLDGYYVQHLGPVIDVSCFVSTIICVLKREGVVEGEPRGLGQGSRLGAGGKTMEH